jgi:hypothetical protein
VARATSADTGIRAVFPAATRGAAVITNNVN